MATLTVLERNGNLMKHLGFFSNESLSRKSNDFFSSVWTYFTLFTSPAFIISTTVFICRNVSTRFDLALRTAIVLLGESQSLGVFVNFGMQLGRVKTMHLMLQKIVDETSQDTKNNASNIYWLSELKCRKFTKIMTYYIAFHVNAFIIAIIHAAVDICFGNFDTSLWNTPFNVVVPFNTESVWGWFWRWYFELSASLAYVVAATITTSYFVSFCFYVDAICNHFNLLPNSLPRFVDFTKNTNVSQKHLNQMQRNIKKQFHQAIKLNVELYDVFQLAREISSGTIFYFLPINGVIFGLTIYTMEHSEFDLVVFGFDVICTICTLVWLTLFCYNANFASDRVASIAHSVYNWNWFEYPLEVQKYTILVIAHSQEPIYFVGFGLIRCTIEVLGKIIRSAGSYYIIFRSISQ